MVTEAEIKEEEYQLRRVAAGLGMIQGLTWAVLSIICIAYYIRDTDVPYVDSYSSQRNTIIYSMFLARQMEPFSGQSLRPSVFFAFMWVYLVLDIIWLVASARIAKRTYAGMQLSKDTRAWSYCTFVICSLDFITVVILGSDYNHCLDLAYGQNVALEQFCSDGVLIVLVIAAKGFVLWIVNLIFAKLMLNTANRLRANAMYQTAATSPQFYVQPSYAPPNYPQNWRSGEANYQYQPYSQQTPTN